jgi:hypothetical protein
MVSGGEPGRQPLAQGRHRIGGGHPNRIEAEMPGAGLDGLPQGIAGENLALLPAAGRPLALRPELASRGVQKSRSA